MTNVPESGAGAAEVAGGGAGTYTKRGPLCGFGHPPIRRAMQYTEVQTPDFMPWQFYHYFSQDREPNRRL